MDTPSVHPLNTFVMTKHAFLQLAAFILFVIAPNLHPVMSQTGITKYGYQALASNTTGDYNSAFGYRALRYNTSGSRNTATGLSALHDNTSGSYNTATGASALTNNTIGHSNTATGNSALLSNTGGSYNTATGSEALLYNTTGFYNTANGYQALYYNASGNHNTANGYHALRYNTSGYYNTAIGSRALYSNTTGYSNTAKGSFALYSNASGYYNTATGRSALHYNTTGNQNTATGAFALQYNTTGSYNTALGRSAGPSSSFPNLSNTTALGYAVTTTAPNQVRIGNNSVTSIGGKVGWTTLSDGRYKHYVQQDVPGLEFIMQLRPVTYTVDIVALDKALGNSIAPLTAEEATTKTESAKVKHTGFVAQEVEEIAKKLNYEFSGVDKPKNDKDFYGLRYAEFVVPLVKAVQELNKKTEEENQQLKLQVAALQERLTKLEALITGNNNTSNLASAYLEQSTPNPSSGTTLIRYYVPQYSGTAHLVFTDIKGVILKSITISNKGVGQLSVNTAAWTAGTYTYTLYINGTQADSKKLVIAR
jgi:trimeric autotransporter adhesin